MRPGRRMSMLTSQILMTPLRPRIQPSLAMAVSKTIGKNDGKVKRCGKQRGLDHSLHPGPSRRLVRAARVRVYLKRKKRLFRIRTKIEKEGRILRAGIKPSVD